MPSTSCKAVHLFSCCLLVVQLSTCCSAVHKLSNCCPAVYLLSSYLLVVQQSTSCPIVVQLSTCCPAVLSRCPLVVQLSTCCPAVNKLSRYHLLFSYHLFSMCLFLSFFLSFSDQLMLRDVTSASSLSGSFVAEVVLVPAPLLHAPVAGVVEHNRVLTNKTTTNKWIIQMTGVQY